MQIKSNQNDRLIVVFGRNGCGDRLKRSILGRVAEQHADITIITSESPYQEDPKTIIDGILSRIQDKINENRKGKKQYIWQWN
ncbi:unnamed protein product [Rotaria sordida]|uniref:Uncharacterized protein n=1 Tax=Rotaria sordida TaxID=392033 RepID=A0A816EVY3_9BILA|nr:unnamed protein product [Rotaria sordida]CAF1652615.1 unnamed protein product [Rotaria sordida]